MSVPWNGSILIKTGYYSISLRPFRDKFCQGSLKKCLLPIDNNLPSLTGKVFYPGWLYLEDISPPIELKGVNA